MGHAVHAATLQCRHAARDRANGLVISASLSRQRSLKGESRYLHHIEQAGFFVQPVFVYVLYGGDIRDVSPVGHAVHAATLHARADTNLCKCLCFPCALAERRVPLSPPNGNYPNTTITEQWVRVVFLLPPKE